jgi:hypothetical protein
MVSCERSVHPWTIVHQSEDKWRAAQDYSVGTNARVVTRPFSLPTFWDVGKVVGPNTHFGCRDLRDGFWATTIRKSSRHHLMVRHPATGALLRCTARRDIVTPLQPVVSHSLGSEVAM